jgi:hypothetical protein
MILNATVIDTSQDAICGNVPREVRRESHKDELLALPRVLPIFNSGALVTSRHDSNVPDPDIRGERKTITGADRADWTGSSHRPNVRKVPIAGHHQMRATA